jgi:hypothetical protein
MDLVILWHEIVTSFLKKNLREVTPESYFAYIVPASTIALK